MKKLISLICMITCVFGLTACGSGANVIALTPIAATQLPEGVSIQGIIVIVVLIVIVLGLLFKRGSGSSQETPAVKQEAPAKTGIDNAVSQIVTQEESEDVSDDMALVAVIAAAIAAYEGSASASGYVVRSIRKRR